VYVVSCAGTYVCNFNGTKDLTSIDNNTALHMYVYDQVHLLTREGFDYQQFVQVGSHHFFKYYIFVLEHKIVDDCLICSPK
jgi:hypothetical protein